MVTASALELVRGWTECPSCEDTPGHLPEVCDNPHRPAERRAQLLHITSPPGCPVSPGIAGSSSTTQGPPLPDVSDAGDRGLVDNLRAHELRGAILAVLWLLRRQLLRVAEVTDSDLLAAQICHQEVFWLQDSAEQRGAWQEARAFPRERMFSVSRTTPHPVHQEPFTGGTGQEESVKTRTHFDVQVQDTVLVQVADPFQDLPHVRPNLQEME